MGEAGQVSLSMLTPPVGKTETLGDVARDLKKVGGGSNVAYGPAPIIDNEELILPDKQAILGMLRNPVFKTTYEVVISDYSSDTDTVVSAIAEAQRIKKAAELKGSSDVVVFPVIQGELNDETLFILRSAGINLDDLIFLAEDNVENLLTALAKKGFTLNITLTDHSKLTGKKNNLQILNGKIIRVIDHHPISDKIKPAEAIYEKVGSTNTLIFERFVKSGTPIPKNAGLLMLSAILSDTKNLVVNTTDRDKKAAEELRNILGYTEQNQKNLFIRQTYALNTIKGSDSLRKILNPDNLRYFPSAESPKYSFTTFRLNYDEKNLFFEELKPLIADYLYRDLRGRGLDVAFFNLTHLNEQGALSSELEELYIIGTKDKVTAYMDATGIAYQDRLEKGAELGKDVNIYQLKHKGQAPRKETVAKITGYFLKAEQGKTPKISEVQASISRYIASTKTQDTTNILLTELAQKLNIPKEQLPDFTKKFRDYVSAQKVSFEVLGGEQFSGFVDTVKQTQEAVIEPLAVIVDAESFKTPGTYSTVLEALRLAGANFKIGLFGKGAENFKILLGGSDNIVTAGTDKEAIAKLKEQGVSRIKLWVPSDIPTITMAATLTALYNTSEVDKAFGDFYKAIQKAGVIDQQAYDGRVNEVYGKINEQRIYKNTAQSELEQLTAIELPKIGLTKKAADTVEKEAEAVKAFIAEFVIKD